MSRNTAIQLRHLFEIVSGSTPQSGNASYWGGDIAWVTPEDVSQVDGNVLRDTRRKLTAEGFANSGGAMASAGGIVLTKRAPIGQLALLGLDACSNQGCFLLSAREGTEPRFFYYVLANSVPLLQALGRGSTFMELSTDDLKALRVPVLSHVQQVRIADYLDASVAKVDELLRSKLCLLEILAEKRKTIIATAVTRGLDPKVKLRDSGVPWLGEIPAHWEHRNLRFCCTSIQTGGTPAPEFLDYEGEDGLDWLTPGDFSESLVPERSSRRVAPGALSAGDLKMFPPGAVLVVGIGATLGKVALLKQVASANQQVNALTPREDVDGAYLAYEMSVFGDLLRVSANTATLPILNQQRMGDVTVLVPPLAEQKAIVERIVRETAKLDAVRAATERTITLLKERRSALIAAAVTGQLDMEAAA